MTVAALGTTPADDQAAAQSNDTSLGGFMDNVATDAQAAIDAMFGD